MIFEITLALTIIAFSATVSQSFMYIIALRKVQNDMEAPAYIELRKLLDINFRAKYKYVVYASLISNIFLVAASWYVNNEFLLIFSSIALLSLMVDVALTIKGNMPINKRINGWLPDNYPDNWEEYRSQWLRIFCFRQIANLTGFACLITGAVFGMN